MSDTENRPIPELAELYAVAKECNDTNAMREYMDELETRHFRLKNLSTLFANTLCEAAIQLRIPRSGNAEIDAMIREANRREAAVAIYQASMTNDNLLQSYVESSKISNSHVRNIMAQSVCTVADAMLAQLEKDAANAKD